MDDPWFNYFRGRFQRQLVPRNRKGWVAIALLIAAITLPALALPWELAISPWLLVPHFALILLIVLAFARWARGRSRVIDIDKLGDDYSEFQEWKKRHHGERKKP